LKALTYRPTGAIVAAVTTSLTESPDVPKNWDYRYCWLRDATFAMLAFIQGGYREEAGAWRDWLLRAVAGKPEQLQPVYGIAGEPRIPEWKVPWLSGRSGRHGVRVGNTAFGQVQLDVYGEVIDALHHAGEHGIRPTEAGEHVEAALVERIQQIWKEPDRGIWEWRHAPEQFTHSKVMAWVGIDRAIRGAERRGHGSPIKRWRRLREAIHADVCRRGFDATVGTCTRSYETRIPDASALLIPIFGFLPADDPRVAGTVRAIEKCLSKDGFVRRYDSSKIPGEAREGAFLACSFWLIDNLLLQGQHDRAEAMFERLLAIRNDVGLLAEEYDPDNTQFRGNFPQALSHLCLVNTAFGLARTHGSRQRTRGHVRPASGSSPPRRASARNR
jgi:GH15 family glucan-1,4-alpha-glucosidase